MPASSWNIDIPEIFSPFHIALWTGAAPRYFGKSEKRYQNVLEIITGKIKAAVLEPAQKKAFFEIEAEIIKLFS